jgi:hypothetical protein
LKGRFEGTGFEGTGTYLSPNCPLDREARRLDREARQIGRLARLYGRDGLSPSERAELETRARILRDAVNRPRGAGGGGRRRGGR